MTFKSLMLGAAMIAMVGPAFAYTSSGTTTVSNGPTMPGTYQTTTDTAPDNTTTTTTTIGSSTGATPLNNVGSRKAANANQTMVPAGTAISNPQQISACLCQEQSYQSLQGQVSAKQAAYDQAVQQRASLDNQLASERAKGAGDVDVIRLTSEQRIALQGQINDVYIPQLQAATSQYNAAVTQYKQSCAGKLFDANVEAQVQSTLQCRG